VAETPRSLAGKVAIVTGGGRGIGRAVALAFAGAGAKVAVAARHRDEIDAVAEAIRAAGGDALGVACDVADRAAVEAMVARAVEAYGRLDILVNNAGDGGERTPIAQSDPDRWARVMQVNLLGPYYACRAAVPRMRESGGGKIINTGSGVGHTARPGNASYAASKAALWSLTRSLAMEVWKDGIDVNEVIPGPVDTRLAEPFFHRGGEVTAGGAESERVKTPEECVPIFMFLAGHPPGGPTAQTFSLARRAI
jgi:3-oxoacyl-[acyl-carrier protein] reductase